jgi:hypothetical protein
MSLGTPTKINKLLSSWPAGTVALSKWLDRSGVSSQLRQRYLDTGWLEGFGRGAVIRAGDDVGIMGGLYALQQQGGMKIHVGGRTALGMQGLAHYLELDPTSIVLFAPRAVTLPAWFKNHDWGLTAELYNTDFLPSDIGLVDLESKQFSVQGSGRARALMECLYLAPRDFDLVEAYEIAQGLGTLRPDTVQELLIACRSVKVTRLFLYLAEKAGHNWLKYLDLPSIDLGRGNRTVEAGGTYIPKYKLVVPRELAEL